LRHKGSLTQKQTKKHILGENLVTLLSVLFLTLSQPFSTLYLFFYFLFLRKEDFESEEGISSYAECFDNHFAQIFLKLFSLFRHCSNNVLKF
jgi:hypothetical protein